MICLFIIDKLKIILDVNPITLGEGGGVCVCGIHSPQQIKLINCVFHLANILFHYLNFSIAGLPDFGKTFFEKT